MASRLPVPGGDNGNWGTILNEFLAVEHNSDGTHDITAIPQSKITNLTTDLATKVDEGAQVINAKDYGAKGDARRVRGVNSSSASNIVTVTSNTFTNADAGKLIIIYTENGAGNRTTIASVQSGTQITLSATAGITVSGATGFLVYGTDDQAAITSAMAAAVPNDIDITVGPNQPMGTGLARVLLPAQAGSSGYILGSQLSVPSGVNLDAPGMFFNLLADRFSPAVLLNPYSACQSIALECLFGSGIQAGTGGSDQAHIVMGNIRLWHIGEDTEGGGAQRSQNGLALVGYHFEIGGLFAKGGVRTIYHNPGTDALINYAYAIGSHTAVEIKGGNQIAYSKLFVDTGGKSGGGTSGVVLNDQASNISMDIQAFEVVGTTHQLDNVVSIGANSTNVNKDIYLKVQANNTGGNILNMAYTQELTAEIVGSNAPFPSGATNPITTGVVYGAGNTGINQIDAMLETSITAYTGTIQGTYRYSQLDVEHFANPITVAGTLNSTGLITAPNVPSTDIYNGNAITVGEEILPRLNVNSGQPLNASGTLHLTYFTARKTEAINTVRMLSDAASAGGTTLARMGIYSVDGGGNLTLVASTTNDTTLFANPYTPYAKALSATFNKVKGVRYAFGVLVVGSAMPAITATTCAGADASLAPRLCGIVTGQANLPANITAGTVVEDYRIYQATMTP